MTNYYTKTPNWIGVLLLGFYCYLSIRYINNIQYFGLLDNMNLLFHEAGHFVFMLLGEFMSILGGSILQIVIPLLFLGYFALKMDWLAMSFVLVWLATNLFYVATYIADSQEMALPMLIDGMTHDWNYLLIETNLLRFDDEISTVVRIFGWSCMVGGIGFATFGVFKNKTRGQILTFKEKNYNVGNVHAGNKLGKHLSSPRVNKKI